MRRDAALAIGLVLAGWAEIAVVDLDERGLRAVLVAVVSLPLVLRTRAIAVPLAAQVAALSVYALAGVEPETVGETLALLTLAYTLGRGLELRRAVAGVALFALVHAGVLIADDGAADILWVVGVFVVPPWLAGRIIRDRSERIAELETLTTALELERERAAELAAQAERARIAQDIRLVLHDALESMTHRAAGDPSPETFAAIRTEGAEAAAELRRLLGLLHGRPTTADP